MAATVACDLCSAEAAYEEKTLVPKGLDGLEKVKACDCRERHRHCLNQTLLKGLAADKADWNVCDKCEKKMKVDDRTLAFVQGAASQAPEVERLKRNAGDCFNEVFRLQDSVMALEGRVFTWQVAAAAAAVTAVGLLAGARFGALGRA